MKSWKEKLFFMFIVLKQAAAAWRIDSGCCATTFSITDGPETGEPTEWMRGCGCGLRVHDDMKSWYALIGLNVCVPI